MSFEFHIRKRLSFAQDFRSYWRTKSASAPAFSLHCFYFLKSPEFTKQISDTVVKPNTITWLMFLKRPGTEAVSLYISIELYFHHA